MAYRILHLADLHLDRAFAGMGCESQLARRRRRDLREALRRAGDAARSRGCALLTIGGDLYEHERADADTGRFLAELFASWHPLRVAISPGNHDPHQTGSLYARTAFPDNVHVFDEPVLRPLELEDGLCLWGLAHRDQAWLHDPLATAPADLNRRDEVHLALFHGAEMGSRPDGKSAHGPFRAEHIAARGFSLALCGHYHARRLDTVHGLIYPGTPEPLSFDEPGPRGPVLVEVSSDGGVTSEPVDQNRWWAVTARCDLGAAATRTDAADIAVEAARQARGAHDPQTTMLRLDLIGGVAGSLALDAAELTAAVRERTDVALIRLRDLTEPLIDPGAAALDNTARGAFTRAALAAIEAAPDEAAAGVLGDALRYGLQALSGVEVGLR